MHHIGLPGMVAYLVILLELGGGFLVLLVHGGGKFSLGHKLKLRWS
jgi:uncharacterized membrane protein YphA (DoxX/SURF4 family)